MEQASGVWQGRLPLRGCNRPIISYYLCIQLKFTSWVSTGLLRTIWLFRRSTTPLLPLPESTEMRDKDWQEMMICSKRSSTKLLTLPAFDDHLLDPLLAFKPQSVAAWRSNWTIRWVLIFSAFVVFVVRNQSPSYMSIFSTLWGFSK